MKRSSMVLAVGVMALALTGCFRSQAAQPSPPQGGGDYLPTYVEQLEHKQPFPVDICEPHDLLTLLAPCDGEP